MLDDAWLDSIAQELIAEGISESGDSDYDSYEDDSYSDSDDSHDFLDDIEYDPDSLYREDGAVPFIYTDKLIYSRDPNVTHTDLILDDPKAFVAKDGTHVERFNLERYFLAGRFAMYGNNPDEDESGGNLAFWNTSTQLHGKLGECIQALLAEKIVYPNTRVHISGLDSSDVRGVLTGENGKDTKQELQAQIDTRKSEELERRMQKRKQLHMMQAGEKKAAMRELGMVGAQKKQPGQPGVKWWAPQSEGISEDNELVWGSDNDDFDNDDAGPNAKVADPEAEKQVVASWSRSRPSRDLSKTRDVIPDDYYGMRGSITFIYTDELIYLTDHTKTHTGLVASRPDKFPVSAWKDALAIRRRLEQHSLTGRVSPDGHHVAFWNTIDGLHGKLGECLKALLDENFISPDTEVHVQQADSTRVSDLMNGDTEKELQANVDTSMDVEELRKRKELHMMGAGEKKEAMRQLGMVGAQKKQSGQPGVKWWAPQSEGISEETLEEAEVLDPGIHWIDPDSFYSNPGNITFIYTNELITTLDDTMSHARLITSRPDVFGELEARELRSYRDTLETHALVGRVSPNGKKVAFWNDRHQLHGNLGKCLEELLNNGMIEPDTEVFVQYAKPTATSEILVDTRAEAQDQVDTRIDPEAQEELRKRKELHMMGAGEKKEAMRELGMVGAQKKQPGQPGVKWWAPQSEGISESVFDKILAVGDRIILESEHPVIDPDDLARLPKNITFIYTDKLIWEESAGGIVTHLDLMLSNPEEFPGIENSDWPSQYRIDYEAEALFGRADARWQHVAFWNSRDNLQGKLLSCLNVLMEDGIIGDETLLHIPGEPAIPVGEVLQDDSYESDNIDDSDERREALLANQQRKELHMMRAAEKKAAMRKLNMISPQKSRIGPPGVKSWAPHSEGVEE